jgi:hypothetical protein
MKELLILLVLRHIMSHFFLALQDEIYNRISFSDMPHILVSTRIRLESGPTILGDERSDPELMNYLGAKIFHEKCNN